MEAPTHLTVGNWLGTCGLQALSVAMTMRMLKVIWCHISETMVGERAVSRIVPGQRAKMVLPGVLTEGTLGELFSLVFQCLRERWCRAVILLPTTKTHATSAHTLDQTTGSGLRKHGHSDWKKNNSEMIRFGHMQSPQGHLFLF